MSRPRSAAAQMDQVCIRRKQFPPETPAQHAETVAEVSRANARLDSGQCPRDGHKLRNGKCRCGFLFTVLPPQKVDLRPMFHRTPVKKIGQIPSVERA